MYRKDGHSDGFDLHYLAAAACAAYVGSLEQWPQQIAKLAVESGLTGISFLLLINLIFFIAGMFMDVPMALALLVPLFGPAAVAQGVHPIHLGIILCLNLTMGLVTPAAGRLPDRGVGHFGGKLLETGLDDPAVYCG